MLVMSCTKEYEQILSGNFFLYRSHILHSKNDFYDENKKKKATAAAETCLAYFALSLILPECGWAE